MSHFTDEETEGCMFIQSHSTRKRGMPEGILFTAKVGCQNSNIHCLFGPRYHRFAYFAEDKIKALPKSVFMPFGFSHLKNS